MIKNFKEISVIYIEDDIKVRTEVSVVLKSVLKSIYIVSSELEALAIYKAHRKHIDLILCGTSKPSSSGLELLKQMRIYDEKIPFILMSNDENADVFIEAIKYNITSFLKKPVNLKELMITVSKACKDKFEVNKSVQNNEETQSYIDALNKVAIVSKTDLKGNITYVNDIFCEIAQYERESLIGKPHNTVRHPDMPKAAFKGLWENLKKGEQWQGKVKNLAADGTPYHVNATISPLHDSSGDEIVGYIGIRFLTTDDENEKREFKKKVILNLKETKQKESDLLTKIDSLTSEISQTKEMKDQLEHEQMRSLKLVKQINHYEGEIKSIEEKNNKMISSINSKIEIASQGKLELKEKNSKLADTIVEHKKTIVETTANIKKLEERVSEQVNKIHDLRDVIAHREEELQKLKKR